MPHHSEISQTPHAMGPFRYVAVFEEAASPSSSSRSSVVEEHHHVTSRGFSLPTTSTKDWIYNQKGALASPSLGPEKDELKSKHDASPFLMPVDSRRLSMSPHPYAHASVPTCISPGVHDPVAIKQHLRAKMCLFWATNRSYLLVIISTLFGSVMTLFTKLLETGNDGMHPFQILFIRMAISSVFCAAAVYLKKPAEFPLGPRGIRWMLVLRGFTGFFGIYGIWTAIR